MRKTAKGMQPRPPQFSLRMFNPDSYVDKDDEWIWFPVKMVSENQLGNRDEAGL